MKSFGLWYQKIKESDNEVETDNENIPQFSLHVNFWSLEDIKTKENINTPFLDIGIKIKNYKQLDHITFYCPFYLDKKGIVDLSEKLASKNNASIIFNSDCEIQTKDSYTIIEIAEHKEQLLIFPLNQMIDDVCQIQNDYEKGTKIVFEFKKFHEYVKSVDKLNHLNSIYIRFRIKDATLKQHIYFDSELLNKSFESAFSGTRIIDFKVNEKRNIDENVRAEIIVNNQEWATFKDIHFLVMVPSSYDLTSFFKETMTCRELEEGLWNHYLDTEIDFSKGHVLAYHWKDKEKSSKKCEDFACLVKVNYSRAKVSTIIIYMLGVIALGIVSSMIVTSLAQKFGALTWKYLLGGGVPVVFIIIFICIIGKRIR